MQTEKPTSTGKLEPTAAEAPDGPASATESRHLRESTLEKLRQIEILPGFCFESWDRSEKAALAGTSIGNWMEKDIDEHRFRVLNRKRVAVVGMGVVGKALHGVLSSSLDKYGAGVEGYDKGSCKVKADVSFICVPTPFLHRTGDLDGTAVLDALCRLKSGSVAVIRSTVTPRFVRAVVKAFPKLHVFTLPEFLDEDTAAGDTARPSRVVLGGYSERVNSAHHELVREVVDAAWDSRVFRTFRFEDPAVAMMVKLAANAFFTSKNAMFNAFADISHQVGLRWDDKVVEAVTCDPRIGPVHAKLVSKGGRGAGGKCLPKDLEMLIREFDSRSHSEPCLLLKAVSAANRRNLRDSGKDAAICEEVYGEEEER
jgi:UDP-glucose 6-dehydrogenase